MPTRRISEFAELAHFNLDPASIRILPEGFCRRSHVVVLGRVDLQSQDPIHIGVLNPDDPMIQQQLSMRWRRPIRPVGLNLYEIERALEVGFGVADATTQAEELPQVELRQRRVDPKADSVALVDDLIRSALMLGAADIHLERYRGDVDVRLRLDGVLHQIATHVHPGNVQGVINRIKILADMDIAERRFPQDGRFRVAVADPRGGGPERWDCDMRVSVVPGPFGEDVVIRILGGRLGVLPVEQLGMPSAIQEQLLELLANPEGLVLVTGPTGSGKSTTLYSALGHLNDGRRKILTVEDPIEYDIPKVNQKQVNPMLSMADMARAFLRQDPDVILVGEIRDAETADVAVRAAATGHVVLSTLHTSDALGAISRLQGLEIPRELVAEAVLGVVAQRLIRRICSACAGPAEITEAQRRRLGALLQGVEPQAGGGCEACGGSGYKGRTGIFELLVVDADLQDAISDGAHLHEVRVELRRRGFQTLVDDAMRKVRLGQTSVDEVLRVMPYRYLKAAVDLASGA